MKIFFRLLAIGFIFSLFIILGSNLYVLSFGKGKIYTSVADVSAQPVAVVFGGGMKRDGITMSEMQTDRVNRAVELYQAGKVQKILLTGDDGANNVNEVEAMHAAATAAGVPGSAVEVDPHGYNTYKSCDRAKNFYLVTSTIAISQDFHLPRILYYCSQTGIEIVGLSADARDYGWKAKLWPAGIREWLARVKALVAGKSERVGNVVVY